jgi:hypothetical protein
LAVERLELTADDAAQIGVAAIEALSDLVEPLAQASQCEDAVKAPNVSSE